MSDESRVRWEGRAEAKVREDLRALFTRELEQTFGGDTDGQITVYDCFAGYLGDQENKIILGIEVRADDEFDTHIVKLGQRQEVEPDYDGWLECAGRRYVGGRIFLRLTYKELPDERGAVIYQNGYTLFGLDQKTQHPEFLQDVATWAVLDDGPDAVSVERVIRQIYGDLHRWFYRTARPDTDAAEAFYRHRLAKAMRHWSPGDGDDGAEVEGPMDPAWRRSLRQDAIWLLCGQDQPEMRSAAAYLDPYDYVSWALDNRQLPETLVGPAHGDLHGQNVLVGVQRGEAEFPVVYDYGEMGIENVLAWDFVKLEMELKSRLLPALYEDEVARAALMKRRAGKPPRDDFSQLRLTEGERDSLEREKWRIDRARRLAFFYEFEDLLANTTARIDGRRDAAARVSPGDRPVYPADQKIDRALCILLRIRQEAAMWLGYEQPGRHSRWQDEYGFALAIYGLNTAKWPTYDAQQTESALISSGVALARMGEARKTLARQYASPSPPEASASYRGPLAHAHELWKKRRIQDGLELLKSAERTFPHAVPITQELAMFLSERGKHDRDLLKDARDKLEPLRLMSVVFEDYETLCRIGRVAKNLGDLVWKRAGYSLQSFDRSVAWQDYQEAFFAYRLAFEVRPHYFPGINVATLACMLGESMSSQKKEYASQVLELCEIVRFTAPKHDLYWVFASRGEASLISGQGEQAAEFLAKHWRFSM